MLVQAERRGRISPAAIHTFLGLHESLPIPIDSPSTAIAWHDTFLDLGLRRALPPEARARERIDALLA